MYGWNHERAEYACVDGELISVQYRAADVNDLDERGLFQSAVPNTREMERRAS